MVSTQNPKVKDANELVFHNDEQNQDAEISLGQATRLIVKRGEKAGLIKSLTAQQIACPSPFGWDDFIREADSLATTPESVTSTHPALLGYSQNSRDIVRYFFKSENIVVQDAIDLIRREYPVLGDSLMSQNKQKSMTHAEVILASIENAILPRTTFSDLFLRFLSDNNPDFEADLRKEWGL